MRQTKRNRCLIPEHRKQIRAMQKFCSYLQGVQSQHWDRTDALRKENELLRLKLYQALRHIQNNGLSLPETLTGIINVPAGAEPQPGPWWKRIFKI